MTLKNDLSPHNTTNYIFSSSFIQRLGPDWDKRPGHPIVKSPWVVEKCPNGKIIVFLNGQTDI
jgi:hypothetical protein